jgi:hypothetical protein
MPLQAEAIAYSLAPGIALNGVILYSTSLQNRFTYITGRMREINREARALRASTAPVDVERVSSLRAQVDLLARRSRIIRRAILVIYVALFGFILTILELLLLSAVRLPGLEVASLLTFGAGLAAMGTSAWLTWTETFFSHTTILEDVRTSFDAPPPAARLLRARLLRSLDQRSVRISRRSVTTRPTEATKSRS